MKLFQIVLFCSFILTACASLQSDVEKHQRRCSAKLLDIDIAQCFKSATQHIITRRLSIGTRRLSAGDWPHGYQVLVQLAIAKNGKLTNVMMLNPSGSRLLDKKIMHSIRGISFLFVPSSELFITAGFANMKVLVKPAITPLIGEETLLNPDALVIYLPRERN